LANHILAGRTRPRSLPEERTHRGSLAYLFRQYRDGALAAVDRAGNAQRRTRRHHNPLCGCAIQQDWGSSYFWTEHVKAYGEDISLTWFDIGEPLLIHAQPNQIPDRRYGLCTVLIPALGTRLVRNGVEAKGQSWPREREGRPFSTSALAFSESWTEARQ
jgi:hypothetical protein